MNDLLLGIDIGTTGVKAALFNAEGHLLAAHSVEHTTHHLRPGWVEQHPDDWWAGLCAATQHVLQAVPEAAARVAGLAVSSQAPSLIALDAEGQPLRPALIWMDRRAEAEAAQIAARVGAEEVIRISGNRPDPFYVAAKIAWFRQQEPELFRQTRWFAQITGYINHRLTGAMTLDDVHAGLLQLRDRGTGQWSPALCEAVGLDPSCLPPVYPGHHVQGEVSRGAAEATGLRPGTPVMVGTVDGAAAAVEAGVSEEGVIADMTGTSTVLCIPNTGGLTEPAFIAMPHALPGLHLLLAAMVSSGASLKWYQEQFGRWETEQAAQSNEDVFDLLTQQAARAPQGSDGLIFLPYMLGERSPIWHTQARGVFFGLSLATERGAVIRSMLEGTAFAMRHNLEIARKAGVSVREIRSVGGGARSRLWCQIKANILGVPVAVPEAAVGAAFGGAVLAGMGTGLYPDVQSALRGMIRLKQIYDPDLEHAWRYARQYALFRSIYEHLKDDFDRLAEVP
jgi:xylulokinase